MVRSQLAEAQDRVASLTERASQEKAELTRFQAATEKTEDQVASAERVLSVLDKSADEVAAAQMSLDSRRQVINEEMSAEVGGIPVDSDYIVFVIDTSGSMKLVWPRVRAELANILEMHPQVKGVQVMNDMGQYMFSERGKNWLPDSPRMRSLIQSRMASWSPYSNSSPVEGINIAIRDFYRSDQSLSIYVLGDEFAGTSVQDVVDQVRQVNKLGANADTKVRIHGIGFPSMAGSVTAYNFARLMRVLTYENNGTFLALDK